MFSRWSQNQVARGRPSPARLVRHTVLALLLASLAGCGAGESEPQIATVIRDFRAQPSAAGVQLTGRVTRETTLQLVVTRLGGPNPVDIGNVELGRQPAGRFALTWDRTIEGRRPPAGRYRLQLYGDKADGRSRPLVVRLSA
jgi:hypothetical protein